MSMFNKVGKFFVKYVEAFNVHVLPYELKSDDIILTEFGIDIIGEDNTMLHDEVATRVVFVFSEQDALVAAHAEQHQQHQLQLQQHAQEHQRVRRSEPVNFTLFYIPIRHLWSLIHPNQTVHPSYLTKTAAGFVWMGWVDSASVKPPYAWRVFASQLPAIPIFSLSSNH
ncbi:hypothetical protein PILCRDRAFT_15973 [Piloderma croceum F 1598]|uniref:Uncharacterized protein n=1 Tax=Piloderma croceum (strain F 1598) TaxID=765440 RepID=A0A0C3B5T8_PILCF|nr:hypothetical protein PILCRDRAFT_15973 [Piloderma croceum F 1598]